MDCNSSLTYRDVPGLTGIREAPGNHYRNLLLFPASLSNYLSFHRIQLTRKLMFLNLKKTNFNKFYLCNLLACLLDRLLWRNADNVTDIVARFNYEIKETARPRCLCSRCFVFNFGCVTKSEAKNQGDVR